MSGIPDSSTSIPNYDDAIPKKYRGASVKTISELDIKSLFRTLDGLDQGFLDLVARIPDNDTELEQSSDPWLEPKGVKLHVDYSKLAAYNVRMIQALMERIELLETRARLNTSGMAP
ncbi:unnamed protein product [Phytophthora lilii]|uniref:Unnamed protein product n=1 Tax=Phytophthora lilii TaxID=2077276 RepID=A0A9W6TZT1_9STRA|nr:unnamed protein product [Phytophthora lilii]